MGMSRTEMGMITIAVMAANALGTLLAEDFRRLFGSLHVEVAERLCADCSGIPR